MLSQDVLPPRLIGITWSSVKSCLEKVFEQYWQTNLSLRWQLYLEKRGVLRRRYICFSIMIAGTLVSQLALLTIQSSYHSSTLTLSSHIYVIASFHCIVLGGSNDTGCPSALSTSVSATL